MSKEVRRISLGEGQPDIIISDRGDGSSLLKIPVKIPTQYMYRRLVLDTNRVDEYLEGYSPEDINELVSGYGKYLEVP